MRIQTLHLVLAGALALPASVASGKEKEPPPVPRFEGRVDVRLVQVDAWATRSGEPVLDLQQSELKLTEDGKPVDILYFSAPVAGFEPAAAGAPSAQSEATPHAVSAPELEQPAVVAVFLDEAHLAVGSRAKTLGALRGWIAGGGLPKGADTMLVAHERELSVLLGRTKDSSRLLDALDRAAQPSTLSVELRTEERRTIERIHEQQRNSFEQQREVVAPAGAGEVMEEAGDDTIVYFEPPCSGRLLQYAEDFADRVEIETKATLESLASFTASLSALRGRKIVVFVSDGMPSRPGAAAYDYVRTLCDGSGAREGIQYAMDVSAQSGVGTLRGQLSASELALAGETRQLSGTVDDVVAQANSSGVSVWSFGARGLTSSGADAATELRTTTSATAGRQKGELEDVLTALAVDTGGRAIVESNDFGAAFQDLADDLFRSYSIAFASPRAGDGKLHQIRLETTRPGVQLRYRRSWRDSSAEEELARLVAGAIAFGIDRPGLGATATLGVQRGDGGAQRFLLRLSLPRGAVTAVPGGQGQPQGLLRVAISVRAAGSEPTPVRSRTIAVELGSAAVQGSEPFVQDITLPEIGKGALVAVGLRDEVSGEMGVFRIEVGGS